MLTVIREMAEEAERRRTGELAPRRASSPPPSRAARTRSPARPRCSTCFATPASSTRAAPGWSRSCAASRSRSPASRCRRRPSRGEALAFDAIHQELSRFRYCTVFVVEGEGLDQAGLEATLEPIGDSLLVVGDPSALKVHVHTDDPGRALSAGDRARRGRGRRDREHARTDGAARGAAQPRRRARALPDARDRPRRGLPGPGEPPALREPRRDAASSRAARR